MGNSSSQQVPDDNPNSLWVTPRKPSRPQPLPDTPPLEFDYIRDLEPSDQAQGQSDAQSDSYDERDGSLGSSESSSPPGASRDHLRLKRRTSPSASSSISASDFEPTSDASSSIADRESSYDEPLPLRLPLAPHRSYLQPHLDQNHSHRTSPESLNMPSTSRQQPLPIDPGLVEAEGTTHSSPANLDPTRASKGKRKKKSAAATTATTSTAPVHDESGSYVLVSSMQQNGNDPSNYPADLSSLELLRGVDLAAADSTPKAKKGRGRPRKSQTDPDANEFPARPRKRKSKKSDEFVNEDDTAEADSRPAKRSKKVARREDAATGESVDDSVAGVGNSAIDDDHQVEELDNGNTGDGPQVGDDEVSLPQSGPLVKREQEILDALMREYCQMNEVSQRDVNEMVQNTNRAQSEQTKALWAMLYDALPQRPHVSVMRATRRRYHNYEVRGKWTAEDDNTLRDAHEANPGKWVKIGGMLGRMPEDCRDRWRNYLSCGDSRKVDDWSEKEETELKAIVTELMAAARRAAKDKAKEQGHAFREQDWLAHVNFVTVSEKMRHTRSRLQCYTHWRVIQRREGAEVPDRRHSQKNPGKNPSRTDRSLAKYDKMSAADKFYILKQIAEHGAKEESEINWKAIHRQNKGSGWTTRDRKEAFAKMKELVPEQESLNDTIEAVCAYLVNNNPEEFDLTADGDNNDDFDPDTTQALLQQEIDASPGAASKGKLIQSSPPAREEDEEDPTVNGNVVVDEGTSEHDLADLNVARALQGIAQLTQERGGFDRQREESPVEETGFPWSIRPGKKNKKKRSSQRA